MQACVFSKEETAYISITSLKAVALSDTRTCMFSNAC